MCIYIIYLYNIIYKYIYIYILYIYIIYIYVYIYNYIYIYIDCVVCSIPGMLISRQEQARRYDAQRKALMDHSGTSFERNYEAFLWRI